MAFSLAFCLRSWSVEEYNVPAGYTKTITNDGGFVWTVTNSRDYTPPSDTPSDPTPQQKYSIPDTGDNSRNPLYAGLMAASGFGIIALFFVKRKEENEEA